MTAVTSCENALLYNRQLFTESAQMTRRPSGFAFSCRQIKLLKAFVQLLWGDFLKRSYKFSWYLKSYYGGPQLSRQNQNLTAKPNTSQQKQNSFGFAVGICFFREVFGFAVRYFVFAVRFLVFAVTVVGHRRIALVRRLLNSNRQTQNPSKSLKLIPAFEAKGRLKVI